MVVELKSEQWFGQFSNERLENDGRDVDVVVDGKVDRLTAVESRLDLFDVLGIGGASGKRKAKFLQDYPTLPNGSRLKPENQGLPKFKQTSLDT